MRRIRQRGAWRHLPQIARLDEQPRSLKAIMAALEHRFVLRFLDASTDTGVDAAGNSRYVMPPRVRGVILRIAEQESDASQTVEHVCRSRTRCLSTVETLGISTGRPSGRRSWMTLSTDGSIARQEAEATMWHSRAPTRAACDSTRPIGPGLPGA